MAVEIETTSYSAEPFEFSYEPSKVIEVKYDGQNRPAVELIGGEDLSAIIDMLSYQVRLEDYDRVVVLSEGGWYLAQELAKRQDFPLDASTTTEIKTKRANGGGETTIVNPDDLSSLHDKRVLIIDDLVDSAATLETVYEYLPYAEGVAIAKKTLDAEKIEDLQRQENILARTIVGATIPDYWVGGGGLDFGNFAEKEYGYKKGFPRLLNKIVIMYESLQEDNRQY